MFQAIKGAVRFVLCCVVLVVSAIAYLVTMDTMDQSFREWYTKHIHWTD